MAAFTGTPIGAPTYALQIGPKKAMAKDAQAQHQYVTSGVYTHAAAAGSGTGEINLFTLPSGRVRVLTDLSRIVTTQFGAAATLSLGHRAYVGTDGVTVVESAALFGSALAAGGGALDAALTIPAAGYHDFDSLDGVTLFGTVASGNIEATDTVELHLTYVLLR